MDFEAMILRMHQYEAMDAATGYDAVSNRCLDAIVEELSALDNVIVAEWLDCAGGPAIDTILARTPESVIASIRIEMAAL